ncbi:uncharacterized protein LODBEIA_P52330 [Lodderomyces beijingensis]|uniref:1-(5-phosphoribosyl)-5-[(5-phosphoribosylamino)methylideneamino] imidazole-4-carboxamide isomerase n=1 Tax=Lodderomyces beijingensis TaxID=1775926 RepID=A0ABP0ZS94_9ASCO
MRHLHNYTPPHNSCRDNPMTKFRGCIDIHSGQVKQIVGGTLKEDDNQADTPTTAEAPAHSVSSSSTRENFVSTKPSSFYAQLYRDHNVEGCHVIKLGSNPANDEAAQLACRTWPAGFQVGGGINMSNAQNWLDAGASHVILTSWLFKENETTKKMELDFARLSQLSQKVGRSHLVVDLSCRTVLGADGSSSGTKSWFVAMNKWQTITAEKLSKEFLLKVSEYCDEILIHAADVEGLCQGIDQELVGNLGAWCPPGFENKIVYAGGAKAVSDLDLVKQLSHGRVDLTFGSALDIFGGTLVKFDDLIKWNKKQTS